MPISGRTQLYGLLGWPVSHSLSPAMHNAAAAALGLDIVYVPLPVRPEGIEAALRGLPALGFRGVNVTVPHKEAVLPHLDAVFPAAQDIGAVNTIAITSDGLTGFNTDWTGFLADLESQHLMLEGRPRVVLGAGGSARAVVYALLRAGGRVSVLSRRPEQAETLAAHFNQTLGDHTAVRAGLLAEVVEVAHETDHPILINTTPLGLAGPQVNDSPWPEGADLPQRAFVYDLVYDPPRTRLLTQAAEAGVPGANGLGMLVRQAAEAFEIWTGQRPDLDLMLAALPAVIHPGRR
jgi:shikimate dehydrogenase